MFPPYSDLSEYRDTSFPGDACLELDIFIDLQAVEESVDSDFVCFFSLHSIFYSI